MKVLVVSDSFKESLTSKQVAEAVAEGMLKFSKQTQVIKVPVADGGEGTVDAMVNAINGEIIYKTITAPLGGTIESFYAFSKEREMAVIEVAAAVGIADIKVQDRNPMKATTIGVGELIEDAIAKGSKKIIVGLGGTATNDGGLGMLVGLGCEAYDIEGNIVHPSGGNLNKIAKLDVSKLKENIKGIEFILASDVTNPLVGSLGATHVFSPQKGATPEMVELLEENMCHYADILEQTLGKDIRDMQGAGAAGGLGAAFLSFFNPQFKLGVDIVLEANNIEEMMKDVDLVITGEGKIDAQTAYGKTPMGITKLANKNGCKVIGIAGRFGSGASEMLSKGMDKLYCITPQGMKTQEALATAYQNVVAICEKISADYGM